MSKSCGIVLALFVFVVSTLVSSLYPVTLYAITGQTSTWSPQTDGIGTPDFQKANNSEFSQDCDGTNNSSVQQVANTGGSGDLIYPAGLDEAKAADAINKFVEENKRPEGSILENVGEAAVRSAKAANINPFLVIAHAKHESEMGWVNNANVKNANNSFGRSATASQPNWSGSRLWYKWSSGEASVNVDAPENKGKDYGGDQYAYIRKQFGSDIDAGDWGKYFEKYAPVADNNNNPIYHPSDESKPLVQQEVEKMMQAANSSTATATNASSSSGGSKCCSAKKVTNVAATTTISGSTPAEKVYRYLTSKGIKSEVAAGFVGNFMQESGGGTFNLNPTADNGSHRGIAQWDYGNRFAKLRSLKKDKADDLDTQIWYVGYELGLEKDAGSGGYKDALDNIKQATTVEDATTRVDAKYEVSGASALAERIKYAKQAFQEYGNGAVQPSNTPNSGTDPCSPASQATGSFVYYSQNDPKWQTSGLPIANSGCGPTSISMIVASLSDKNVTPVEVAKYLQSTGDWSSEGIVWSGFAKAGKKWNMQVTEIGKDWGKAKEALKAGKMLTISGTGSAPFTSGGHIIVARGITSDDKIIIANPAPLSTTPEQTPYTTAQLEAAGFANMWVFDKGGSSVQI